VLGKQSEMIANSAILVLLNKINWREE